MFSFVYFVSLVTGLFAICFCSAIYFTIKLAKISAFQTKPSTEFVSGYSLYCDAYSRGESFSTASKCDPSKSSKGRKGRFAMYSNVFFLTSTYNLVYFAGYDMRLIIIRYVQMA